MASILYDGGREGFLDGSIDWDTNEIRVFFLDLSHYTFSAAHRVLNDVASSARVPATSTGWPALTTPTVTAGVADAADVTFTSVTGAPVSAILVFQYALTVGGSALAASAARLIGYIDGVSVTPNGGNIQIVWDNGANKIFKL